MSLESVFKALDGDKQESCRATKELGQLHRLWKEQDTYEFVFKTIRREIDMAIDQTTFEQGRDHCSMTFAYIKGLKTTLNRMQWYEDASKDIVKMEEEDARNQKDVKQDEDKFVAGQEAGEGCGTSSIVM